MAERQQPPPPPDEIPGGEVIQDETRHGETSDIRVSDGRVSDGRGSDGQISDGIVPGAFEQTGAESFADELPQIRESVSPEEATAIEEIARQLPSSDSPRETEQVGLDNSGLDQRFDRIRPKDTRRAARWISWIVMTCTFAMLLVGLWLGWTFWTWQRDTSRQALERFSQHPVVLEELGSIRSCRFALLETFSPECPEEDVVAFRVRGERNAGFLYIQASESEETAWAGLRVDQLFWPLESD